MAKSAKPNDPGDKVTNLSSTKKVLAECAAGFRRIDKQRADLNEEAGELRERCRNQGIDPKWLLTAIRVADMEVEDRAKADESYAIAREALGTGLQRSLFETIGDEPPAAESAPRAAANGKAAPKAAKKAAEPVAPPPADDGDLAGDFVVYDPDSDGQGTVLWLMADKESWSAHVAEAGRWGEDRAKQLATEHQAMDGPAAAAAAIV